MDPLHSFRDPREIGECDWVIVAIKSTANDQLKELLKPLVGLGTNLLTLQNGMGNVENLADAFGSKRTIIADAALPASTAPNPTGSKPVARIPFSSGSMVPACPSRPKRWFCLRGRGDQVKRTDSLDEVLWRQVVLERSLQRLGHCLRYITTDHILEDAGHRLRARRLMEEIQAAALAAKFQSKIRFWPASLI